MIESTFDNEKQDSIDLYKFLKKHRKTIFIAVISSVVLSVIVTFFTPKEYFSSATVFPTSSNTLEDAVVNPQFGYDIEADRLIQLMESQEMKDSIVKQYDLVKYYNLNINDNTWADILKKNYDEDIRFSRTQYMSVVISAQTKDPELSANIVNSIINLANGVRTRILKTNIHDAYMALQKEYNEKKAKVDSLVAKIFRMRGETKNPSLVLLNNQVFNLNYDKNNPVAQNTTYLEQAIINYNFEQSRLNEISVKYEKAKTAYERPIPSIYVIEKAIPYYKKVSPSYSINISIAFIFALFASIGILFLKEKFSSINSD